MAEHIVLVGFGNMGRALVRGWLAAAEPGRRITIVDPDERARVAATGLGLTARGRPAEVADAIDIAVLAVKPALLEAALGELPPAGLYLSIAAGRSIADISAIVGAEAPIVRAMPNTPAAIGLGMTGLVANRAAAGNDRQRATNLMAAVGAVAWVDDESDMDALTAVSGSGPAYVFLLIECLTAAGVDAGLDAAVAQRLATETVRGAGAYAAAAGKDAASLRREVTSPGGTTEAALGVLNGDGAFGRLMRDAVLAAARKSRELGRGRG